MYWHVSTIASKLRHYGQRLATIGAIYIQQQSISFLSCCAKQNGSDSSFNIKTMNEVSVLPRLFLVVFILLYFFFKANTVMAQYHIQFQNKTVLRNLFEQLLCGPSRGTRTPCSWEPLQTISYFNQMKRSVHKQKDSFLGAVKTNPDLLLTSYRLQTITSYS